MRKFWMPVLRSAAVEPGGDSVGARILGTDIVVYRGADGSLGSVDEKCPHRRASLALAHNNGTTISCLYHGWHTFGGPLSWEELPGRRASRVAAYSDGDCDVLDTDRHQQYVAWFFDTQERLRRAIDDILPQPRKISVT